MLEYVSSKFNY